ncbi:MAG: hypothetical protein P3W87_007135, partial [Gammaproteobacteria bacterium]|nr:hypothetical protein [Gammaproteobacteria bacterium]
MRKEGWQALGLMAPILSLMRQGHEALTRSGGGSGMVSVEQYKHDIDGWKKTAASWEKNTNEALDLIKKWKADYKELQEKYFATLAKLEALEKKNSYRMFDDWGTKLANDLV